MLNRDFTYDVLDVIQTRWSPRALDPNRKIKKDDLLAILEAASYAPSCFNEQPWEYIVGNDDEDREKILDILNDKNRAWAKNAPVLMIAVARKNFAYNDKPNPWHQFDTGTSWGFLSLEAQKRGIHTHGMAGFSKDKVREVFDVPEDYTVIAAIAMGYYGDKSTLSPDQQEKEYPQPRKPIAEMIFNRKKD